MTTKSAKSRSSSTSESAHPKKRMSPGLLFTGRGLLALGVLFVIGVLVWQGVTAQGAPDPLEPTMSPTSATVSIAVLVFREGLECILVLAAIMASMVGESRSHRKPVIVGAGIGFIATVITWFVAVGIMSSLMENVSALNLQAATGLLAVVVLLVIMNWFFHNVYWGGWITMHNRRKKALLRDAGRSAITTRHLLWGLGLLGFASFYREGFEIVLFLQTYRLKMGDGVVLGGVLIGALLSAIAAVLTFVAHRKLPYRRMLVLTGVMLGAVLLLIVGEQAQEMQLAGWISTTSIPFLEPFLPAWAGMWFAVFPTVETLLAQALAATLVIGSYFWARKTNRQRPVDVVASPIQTSNHE